MFVAVDITSLFILKNAKIIIIIFFTNGRKLIAITRTVKIKLNTKVSIKYVYSRYFTQQKVNSLGNTFTGITNIKQKF